MGKIYNISIGQLITLWVFGVASTFLAFLAVFGFLDNELVLSAFLAAFMVVFIPFLLIFYTIGWKNRKKRDDE